ncbi:coniferyl aldehyde dehydrogenase [Massilia sp. GCM10020059]|uniref:Aldehyde dehydrogenase n=1 Tax=Massilia agrisoli TaxID=2892444 RepID=A0ABS8IQ74_9BURK|nr:coniferyl aldehyde dehydrogenase [Massilia agrisoli]MCC6069424.1 coniferyl aldehyde dehydrogenase [Massilia agrisoli]
MEPQPTTELTRIFALQHAASRASPDTPWAVRADRLERLRKLLRDHRGALASAISADFGQRSHHETELLEINPLLDGIAHSLRHGPAWMRQRRRAVSFKYQPGAASLMPQPLGVAGIVVPWNYPLALSVGPLNGALCAGNRALVKLSELTPRFGELMAALVAQHFAEDELRVFNGDAGFSRQFCQQPFDHLLFTGSTAVGHHVMRAASDTLTPVTLELGGKSPAIIGPSAMSDAQFDLLVRRLVIGKTFNAGQTCIAPDYAFVPRARLAQFIDSAGRAVKAFYPSLAGTGDYTSIINARHFERLQALVDDAIARGATAWPLSPAEPDPQRRIFPPVLLSAVAPGSTVLKEEIFGPVLPVLAYDQLDEAMAWINARPRPLALYLFERDRKIVAHVLAHTVSGGVTVNDTFLHVAPESLPFGGVGASGMGAYHGEAGFRTFSHFKPVFTQAPLSLVGWLYPPFGKLAERILRMPKSR